LFILPPDLQRACRGQEVWQSGSLPAAGQKNCRLSIVDCRFNQNL